jgi:4-amino-4-deoxy-L-arabinose transferase-like glycosyltransferase
MRRTLANPVLWGLIALAAAVRLIGLGDRGLWLDESFTGLLARGRVDRIPDLLRLDSGPPLYYLVTWVVTRVAGTSELVLRLPSALAGIATVPLAWVAAERMGVRRCAWVVALVVAVAPILVVHAQDARYYAFLAPLTFAVLIALEGTVAFGGIGRMVVLAALLATTAYVHNYGLLLLPAAAAYAVGREGRGRRSVLLAVAIAFVAYLPWTPILLDQVRFGGTGWTSDHFTAMAPWATVESWAPLGAVPPYIPLPAVPGFRPLGMLLAAGLLAAAMVGGVRPRSPEGRGILLFAVVPPALVYVVSLVGPEIYLVARADLLFLPAVLLLAGRGLERVRWRAVVPVGAVVWLAAASVHLAVYLESDRKSGDRDLARHLADRLAPGDVVVPVGLAYASIAWYLPGAAIVPLPVGMADHPGNLDPTAIREDPGAALTLFDARLGQELSASPATATVWMVRSPGPLGRMLSAHLGQRLAEVEDPVSFRMGVLGTPLEVVGYGQTGGRGR